jgi:hypothetical protein
MFYFSDSIISANCIGWNESWVLTQFPTSVQIRGTFCKTGQKCAQNNNYDIILWVLFNIVLNNYYDLDLIYI